MTYHPEAIRRLRDRATVKLANLPTPLIHLPRLGHVLGTERLWVKMDAETGFALGGNKVRKLEYILTPAELKEATCLVTSGGPQSNHCRVTAAFAARQGLRCVLVTNSGPDGEPSGNALLQRLFGAEIVIVEDRSERDPQMTTVADELRAAGEVPLIIPIGASTPMGSLGYAQAAIELCEQLDHLDDGCSETLVFSASSSGGTLAGMILGLTLLDRTDVHLTGVSADAAAQHLDIKCRDLAEMAAVTILKTQIDPSIVPFKSVDDQVGEGYGIPTPASREATELFGKHAGIVLDPTYTSKAA
ncbi:MAG TPA: D-cysteine desulfhydrase family protein, partial [Gemmatimonadetes bacterium]|nr:D-cysteine desulfhydrase family protein [Gemmatimonadota bacterium]